MQKPNVLFLCTGNSARSQMAEGLLRHHGGDQFEVYSAGLEPKGVNPFAIQAMDEIGIDIRGQWSKGTKEYMGRMFFSYVITVCGNADKTCPQALWAQGGKKLHWPFEDPAAVEGADDEKLAAFRAIRDQIDTKIQSWLHELEAEAVHG
ncbi:MAG: arsenate reductase ArsC [Anaerolineae bacterium]|nr:arsenate reductase ArsC [Anaerolineae bacterium]